MRLAIQKKLQENFRRQNQLLSEFRKAKAQMNECLIGLVVWFEEIMWVNITLGELEMIVRDALSLPSIYLALEKELSLQKRLQVQGDT